MNKHLGYYTNSYVHVFRSNAAKAAYENMILDVDSTFGCDFYINTYSKYKMHESLTLYSWLNDSVTPGAMDYIKSKYPDILSEFFYKVYCTGVHDDLCNSCYVIDDRGGVININLCTFSCPNTIVEFNRMMKMHDQHTSKVSEITQKRYDRLVAGINGVISERFETEISDYSTQQERSALINILSTKIATSLANRLNVINDSLSDPKQVNACLVEFINGFSLDESKKD